MLESPPCGSGYHCIANTGTHLHDLADCLHLKTRVFWWEDAYVFEVRPH